MTYFPLIYHCIDIQCRLKLNTGAAFGGVNQDAYQPIILLNGQPCPYKYQLGFKNMAITFSLTPDADLAFTSKISTVIVVPSELVNSFGKPLPDDGYKTSGMYAFSASDGEVFTLYDWKATSLYFEDEADRAVSNRPLPNVFWALAEPQELMIAARRGAKHVAEFKEWLLGELGTRET